VDRKYDGAQSVVSINAIMARGFGVQSKSNAHNLEFIVEGEPWKIFIVRDEEHSGGWSIYSSLKTLYVHDEKDIERAKSAVFAQYSNKY
jgi:hypothetical protein